MAQALVLSYSRGRGEINFEKSVEIIMNPDCNGAAPFKSRANHLG